MGVILAKFRKQKTTYQILEKLEEDIKEAEALTISTKEKQRRFIVNLYLVSIGLLVLGCLLYRTQQVKTPFPIINQNEKKFFDKILVFLMGEGQSSLYGMVCKECMVSLEEYEYSAFRCAFCKVLNPAKKIRHKAPALSIENIGSTIRSSSSTSSSESESNEKSKAPMTGDLKPSGDVQQQPTVSSEANVQAETEDNVPQSTESREEEIDDNVEEKSEMAKKTD